MANSDEHLSNFERDGATFMLQPAALLPPDLPACTRT